MVFYLDYLYFNEFSNFLFTEGELEAEWLTAAGFPQLIKPFEQVNKLYIKKYI